MATQTSEPTYDRRKADELIIRGKLAMMQKKDGVDQIIIMFIIIAVAAGIAGLSYLLTQTVHSD